MMKKNMSIFFIAAIVTGLYLSAQENSAQAETLEQRRQRVNEFVRQELAKGTSIRNITWSLDDLVEKTDEGEVWKHKFDGWMVAREELQKYKKQYCQSCYEEYRSAAYNPREGRILASQQKAIAQASTKIEQCERECSENDKGCQDLEQKLKQVEHELNNAKTNKWNTPEAKLYDQARSLRNKKIEIKNIAREIRTAQKNLRPLESAKEELEKEEEAMLNELKAQISQ
jgi:chromosome segregation ATPase